MNERPVVLSIICTVYNLKPYLAQCLDGIVMQQTDFRFEAIVHDDVSTDGSVEIIKEYARKYPDIIKPVYEKENQFKKHDGSLRRAVLAAMSPTSKYVSNCDGDDYWTDPLKLQKQVSFLESHPDYGAVYAKAPIYKQEKGKFTGEHLGRETNFHKMLLENTMPTQTVCFRRSLYEQAIKDITLPHEYWWKVNDYPFMLYFSYNSKVKFMDENQAVYRELPRSLCHSQDGQYVLDYRYCVFRIREYFAEKYHHEEVMRPLASIEVNFMIDYCAVAGIVFDRMEYWHYIRKYRLYDKITILKYLLYKTLPGRKLLKMWFSRKA